MERLNVNLSGDLADKFRRIKEYLNLSNDSEVIRTLVRLYYQEHEKELIGPPKTMWHMNLNEYGVLIWDPDLRTAVQINFSPEGIQCEYDESTDCKHIIYALSVEAIKEVVNQRRLEGWKLPKL